MPCVVCKGDTKKGFTYCASCMEKDMNQKRLEQENEIREREKFIARKNTTNRSIDLIPSINDNNPSHRVNTSMSMMNNLDLTDLDDNFLPNKIIDKKVQKIDDKKQIILTEMKTIRDKMSNIENLLKETNTVKEVIIHKQSEINSIVFILVSRDHDDLNHIHGIFTNIDKGMTAFKKIVLDADKYSKIIKLDKIILYKSQVDELDTSFDTALFDDCEMEIIIKKDFNNVMIQNK